jgi:hypothetical protein
MAWPTPQDYNEAIQNPRLSFGDPELRQGVPETTALGLPRPITGNFASVYRVRCTEGDWAVRCFWREFDDMQERYAAISSALERAHLPYTADFEYLPHGIKVSGMWYPILKMEWVAGELLHEFVQHHLEDPPAIRRIARRWREMVATLEQASVAHGDLQHGNILVVDGNLKLVDYDGMYVPQLAGKPSHELGHQNYQSPNRSARDFGPALDRFATWVIYLSLLAVSAQPAVWSEMNGGDECLLLRRKDFEQPTHSEAFRILTDQPDDQVRSVALMFRSLLGTSGGTMPPLELAVSRFNGHHGFGKRLGGKSSTAFLAPIRAAWQTMVPSSALSSDVRTPVASTVPSWVTEHVAASAVPRPKEFVPPVFAARAALTFAAVALGVSIVPGLLPSIHSLLPTLIAVTIDLGFAFAALVVGFRRVPEVAHLRRALVRERRARRELAGVYHRVQRLERQRQELSARYTAQERRRETRCQGQEHAHKAKLFRLEAIVADIIAPLERQRRELDELELKERVAALESVQEQHMEKTLRGIRLRSASLRSVGASTKARLWLHGIRSARDINIDHVAALKRLDGERVQSLVAWRVLAEKDAKRTAPRTLSAEVRDPITARYSVHRGRLDRLAERARARSAALSRELSAVQVSIKARQGEESKLAAEMRDVGLQCVQRSIERTQVRETGLYREVAQCRTALETYAGVTFGAYVRKVLSL